MLMVFQQFSGINAVIFFSSSILQSGGIDDPNEGGLIVMAVQVVMTGVAVLLMDRAGRRLLPRARVPARVVREHLAPRLRGAEQQHLTFFLHAECAQALLKC